MGAYFYLYDFFRSSTNTCINTEVLVAVISKGVYQYIYDFYIKCEKSLFLEKMTNDTTLPVLIFL